MGVVPGWKIFKVGELVASVNVETWDSLRHYCKINKIEESDIYEHNKESYRDCKPFIYNDMMFWRQRIIKIERLKRKK